MLTVEQIVATVQERFKMSKDQAAEVAGWLRGVNLLEQDTFEYLFHYYAVNRLIPYDVVKGNKEDPTEWIFNKLSGEFNG